MANSELTEFLTVLRGAINAYLSDNGDAPEPADKPARKTRGKATAKADPEPEAESDEDEGYKGWSLKELREELVARDYPADDVKGADKDTLIGTLEADDAENADGGSDDADDENGDEGTDDAEAGDVYDRDELAGLGLVPLKGILKENGWTTADLKGKDKDELIELILGGEEDEDGDDEDESDDADDDAWDEDSLGELSRKELIEVADEYEVEVKRGAKPASIIAAILEAQEEAE